MNFEHLIQINDLQNPLVETLNRDQVWQGLLHRVEDATPFLPGLESCTILERHADHLLRKLDFGAAVIHDRVTLVEQHWVRFDILPGEQHAGGSLTIEWMADGVVWMTGPAVLVFTGVIDPAVLAVSAAAYSEAA